MAAWLGIFNGRRNETFLDKVCPELPMLAFFLEDNGVKTSKVFTQGKHFITFTLTCLSSTCSPCSLSGSLNAIWGV